MELSGLARDFAAAVERRFAFLAGFGYALEESGPGAVRYRRGEIELAILRDWRSGEIELAIGPRDGRCSFTDLLRERRRADAEGHRDPWPSTVPELARALDAIAELLLEHPRSALEGDAAFYAEARNASAAAASKLTHDLHLADVRRRAEAAFDAGEHARVVELYETVAADLDATERKRLAIALERLGP